jgi:sulfite reductase (NADPH) flavoprotein alpha-component
MYTRTSPYVSRVKERALLTGPTSTKKTYHVVLTVEDPQFHYQIGDSVGVLPHNDPDLVERILHKISATGEETIFDSRTQAHYSFKDYLLARANLSRINSTLFKLLCERGIPSDLTLSEHKAQLTVHLNTYTLLDLLQMHEPATLTPTELCSGLMPLMPRFYSIASSQKVFPHEVHLTVSHVSYTANGQMRFGVGSHFLCDLATLHQTPVPIYIQPSNHFTLPADPTTPIILIGPGTGIAPFRAFLQERLATQAPGRNWVFFGERNRAADFYYEDYWTQLEKLGHIRLDLAFSRDQAEKIYVQHRMLESKKLLWSWIQEGAVIYVCGDALKMAKDVDATLQSIIAEEGAMNQEEARQYLKTLRAQKRYLLDVY